MITLEDWDASQINYDLTEARTALAAAVQEMAGKDNRIVVLTQDNAALIQENADLKAQLANDSYDEVVDGNVQALLNSKGPGATINLPPVEYRLREVLVPQAGQTIIGAGTVFKGSKTIGTWEREGDYYVATGQLPTKYTDVGQCEINTGEEAGSCQVLEDVFNGGIKLDRVMQLKNLVAGKVYSDYVANKIYILDVPNNVELSTVRHFMNTSVNDVNLVGISVEQFASPSQKGALTVSGKNWEIDGCWFEQNHSSGLHVTTADGLHVHNSVFRKNGQAGMTHHRTNDSIIEYNTFEANNTAGYYKRDWESAGLKITYSQRVTVRFNDSLKNEGVGIWLDIDNKDISILSNTVKDNFSCGIRVEIGFDTIIKNNTIVRNGFGHAGPGRGSDYSGFATAGIHINGAGGMGDGIILIENNDIGVLADGDFVSGKNNANQNAIHLEERFRGKSVTYPTVTWTTRNVKVRNNRINITRAAQGYGTGVAGMGVLGSTSGSIYDLATGNEFEGNKYYSTNVSETQFHVRDTAINQYRNFQRWQGLGYDKTGSITAL